MKTYRDLKNSIDTAREEGKIEMAKTLKNKGIDIEVIIEASGLTREETTAEGEKL